MRTGKYQILNRFFSKQVLLDLFSTGSSSLYHNCVNRLLHEDQVNSKSNLGVIKELYSISDKFYRNEYFYKNTILNKLLLGRHNIWTTIALNEVPIDKSVADLILINGKAILYEIKSEIDNIERLSSQIDNYYKAFDTVCVVTHEGNEQNIRKNIRNDNVGIIVLTNRNQLSERKVAKADSSMLSNESIFKILRKREYEDIIQQVFGKLPSSSAVMYYRECLSWVSEIEPGKFYEMALDELRKRNISHGDEYQKFVPYELKFPMYFARLRGADYLKLDSFLSANYGG